MTNTKTSTDVSSDQHAKNKKNEFRSLENADKILDSSILQHSLDILCRLLKKTDPESQEHVALIEIFPILLQIALESQDVYLLLHTTSTLRTFIAVSHEKIKEKKVTKKKIIKEVKKVKKEIKKLKKKEKTVKKKTTKKKIKKVIKKLVKKKKKLVKKIKKIEKSSS